jgi:hypothetical protein
MAVRHSLATQAAAAASQQQQQQAGKAQEARKGPRQEGQNSSSSSSSRQLLPASLLPRHQQPPLFLAAVAKQVMLRCDLRSDSSNWKAYVRQLSILAVAGSTANNAQPSISKRVLSAQVITNMPAGHHS